MTPKGSISGEAFPFFCRKVLWLKKRDYLHYCTEYRNLTKDILALPWAFLVKGLHPSLWAKPTQWTQSLVCCTASSGYKLKTKKNKQVFKEEKNEGRHWDKVIDLLKNKTILQLGSKLRVERRERKQDHMLEGKCLFSGSFLGFSNRFRLWSSTTAIFLVL